MGRTGAGGMAVRAAGYCLLGISLALVGCSREGGEGAGRRSADSAALALPDSAEPTPHPGPGDRPPEMPADSAAENVEGLSNELICWGVQSTSGGRVPLIPASWSRLLDRYGGICLGDTAVREVFLTFDAGYEGGYTSSILDVLREEGVTVTFFITGHYIRTAPSLVERMVAEGHSVGNHTDSHPSMPGLDAAGMRAELLAVGTRFKALTGQDMRYFRPPSGEFSERTLAVARQLGYVTVLWSLAFKDWVALPGGPDESCNTVTSRLHNGAVILLHVTSPDNSLALRSILRSVRERGYRFGSLDKLVGGRTESFSGHNSGG
jgi:peptidoglycan-N-acetylmuramic acid deacetylase